MATLEDTRDRISQVFALAGIPHEPTEAEQRRIDLDAEKSVDVLCADLPRPPQVNEKILRAIALENIERYRNLTAEERQVLTPHGGHQDVLDFQKAYRKKRIKVPQLIDDPWTVGTKILVLYAGSPRVVVPIDSLDEWPRVAELLSRNCTRKPLFKCDVAVSTHCTFPMISHQITHYKEGQYLVLMRTCEHCADFLMFDSTPARRKRLLQLLRYVDPPDPHPNLTVIKNDD